MPIAVPGFCKSANLSKHFFPKYDRKSFSGISIGIHRLLHISLIISILMIPISICTFSGARLHDNPGIVYFQKLPCRDLLPQKALWRLMPSP